MLRPGLTALAILAVAAAAPAAEAAHVVRPCGKTTVAKRSYRVRAQGVTCAFARRWSVNYLKRRTRPAGWTCTRVAGTRPNVPPFYCRRGQRSYFVLRS